MSSDTSYGCLSERYAIHKKRKCTFSGYKRGKLSYKNSDRAKVIFYVFTENISIALLKINQLESLLRSEIHDLQQIFVRSVIKIHVWLPSHNIDHFWEKYGRFFHNIETVHSWVIFFHQQHLSISQCDIIKVWYITVWYCHSVILSHSGPTCLVSTVYVCEWH